MYFMNTKQKVSLKKCNKMQKMYPKYRKCIQNTEHVFKIQKMYSNTEIVSGAK